MECNSLDYLLPLSSQRLSHGPVRNLLHLPDCWPHFHLITGSFSSLFSQWEPYSCHSKLFRVPWKYHALSCLWTSCLSAWKSFWPPLLPLFCRHICPTLHLWLNCPSFCEFLCNLQVLDGCFLYFFATFLMLYHFLNLDLWRNISLLALVIGHFNYLCTVRL